MSRSNIEIVRQGIDVFGERGLDGLEDATDLYAEDVEFHEGVHLPEPGVYRGIRQIRDYFRGFVETFEDYSLQIEGIHASGSKVVVVIHHSGRVRGSSAEVEMRNAWVFKIAFGKISRIEAFGDPNDAFAAAGISA